MEDESDEICILRRMCLLVTRFRTVIYCQLDLDAVIELAYSGERGEKYCLSEAVISCS
jgi:hypothetical protein